MVNHMIDYLRYALYAVLIFVMLMLYQDWEKEHPKTTSLPTLTTEITTAANYVPTVASVPHSTASTTTVAEPTTVSSSLSGKIIHVKTDTLDIRIDTAGGNIIQVDLPQYHAELHSTEPLPLLTNNPELRYIAQSGLISAKGPDTSQGQAIFTADQSDYTFAPGQNELQVKLHWQNNKGLHITKIFAFQRNSYEIGVSYHIDNQSREPWEGNLYLQLMRKNAPPKNSQGLMNLTTYFGAAISSPDKPFEKISFKEMGEKNLNQTITGGWAAMIQHYFVSAWVPDKSKTSQYFTRITPDNLYTVGLINSPLLVNPGQQLSTDAKFYAGPAIASQLEKVAPGLQLTIDYGWLWLISIAIFWMMQKIYNFIGNWGWSIVIVTFIIKLMFYHLSAKSFRSMSVLKKLQPKINALKERFGEDKQKFTQATLELYRKEKVNPMSGCLPMLIQVPVFIGLYWVLVESVQLRHAPFILWVHDLSAKDPYYILPILMGLSFFLQQRLNPPSPDPMQAKMMMLMPIILTVLFLNFPAGLMLYMFVNNVLSLLQQWYIMRTVEKAETIKKSR